MDSPAASARVNLALKRSVFLGKSFICPRRPKTVFQPVSTLIQYFRPAPVVKSILFVVPNSTDALRQRFADSRIELYNRLMGLTENNDCGCEGDSNE